MRRALPLVLAALSGCSLLLDFGGEEGRPCKDGECLPGYVCEDDVCVSEATSEAGLAASCVEDADCEEGLCLDGDGDGRTECLRIE